MKCRVYKISVYKTYFINRKGYKGMDSQVLADGRLLDLVDSAWRAEELPLEDIMVPAAELPDPEADNGDSHTTLKEAESKWTDLALSALNEQHMGSSTAHNAAVYL